MFKRMVRLTVFFMLGLIVAGCGDWFHSSYSGQEIDDVAGAPSELLVYAYDELYLDHGDLIGKPNSLRSAVNSMPKGAVKLIEQEKPVEPIIVAKNEPVTSTTRSVPEGHSAVDTFKADSVKAKKLPAQPQPADVWARMRQQFSLKREVDNPRVVSQIKWFQRNPDYLIRVTQRAERYMYDIVEELERRNMPLELALLPIVESAFDPFAYSHGSAAGLWQFIASTGKEMGLAQNLWYDARRDAYASTRAALSYLQRLSAEFDSNWYLALASYNTGPGNVRRAIKKNIRQGKPGDFWSLKLPRETRAYVPKLLAVAEIVANPERYNLALYPVANKPYFKRVYVGTQIDLAYAAQAAELELEDFYVLNPGFNQLSTPPEGPHYLLLPVAAADQFYENMTDLPDEAWIKWRVYWIKPGDTLSDIAERFRTSVKMLKAANRLSSTKLGVRQKLLIPKDSRGISEDDLVKHLAGRVWGAYNLGAKKLVHPVREGDTLWGLAREYKVSIKDLMNWNDLEHAEQVYEGRRLLVWVDGDEASDRRIRTVRYRVRNGDSLYGIANKFRVSVNDIKRWNKKLLGERYLYPGVVLTLSVDVARQF